MQKSNWRKEIEILKEFVAPGDNPGVGAGLIGTGANILKKVIQHSPKVKATKKIFDVVKDVAPKIQKKLEPEVDKVNTEKKPIKGFKPTPFKPTPFKPTIEPKPIIKPGEPEPERELEPEKTDDNKKKIKKITKIRNNNIDKNKQKNDQNIKNKDLNKDKVRVPLVTKTRTQIKNKTTRRVPSGRLPRILPVPIPIGRRKATSTPKQRKGIERLAPTRDMDGDGKLEFKRKSGDYQETYNYSKTMNSTTAKPKPTTKPSLSQKVKRLEATRDRDGDGKLERKRKSGEYQEALLYDIVYDYIITENFASDTEGANKIMLKLSDELMQEIYERTMTASEKRKDTMLKKKYDDSDMKKNMQGQYGKEEGKKVYFATIRKQAMKKEEVEQVDEKMSNYDRNRKAAAKRAAARNAARDAGKTGVVPGVGYVSPRRERETYRNEAGVKMHHKGYKAEEVEVVDEAKYEKGASDYGKTSIRNKRAFGKGGNARPPEERGAAKMLRHDAHQKRRFVKKNNKYGATNKPPVHGAPSDEFKKDRYVTKEEVGITTHSMMMKDKAKKEAMIRMKERDAVAKKLRKEERDEYGDPVGGPKISKKQKEKNLKKNTPDEQHTTTTSEGYGSERVGPALTMARAIDKVNPRPKPNSKRTMVSRALKMASIKKDEKIRKRQENPYSTDKKLKMVATSIRDRVKRKVKSMAANEDYIPEEGYDIARDMGRVPKTKDKKDATTMPPSEEMKKTQKVNKGPSALERVKKKYGKAVMDVKKK